MNQQHDAPEGGAENRVDLGPAKYDLGRKLNAIVSVAKTWEDAAEYAAALFAPTPPAPVRLMDTVRAFGLGECIRIAQRGFDAWAAKDHNRRWFRKIDGTPIPNDLTVNIAEAFADAFVAVSTSLSTSGETHVEDNQSDHRLRVQPYEEVTPPAPSGLVDAVLCSRCERTVEEASRHGCGDVQFDAGGGEVRSACPMNDVVEKGRLATLSGQQGGAVPAGDLRPGLEEAAKVAQARALEIWERRRTTPADFGPRSHEYLLVCAEQKVAEGLRDELRARLAEQPAPAGTFQDRNAAWMEQVFVGDPTDIVERRSRFGEEALELQQALGQTAEEAHALVDYVHGRPIGEPGQEYGGTMTTLALLASVTGHDLMACGEAELARCSMPEIIAKIREKRSKRHGRGPLPGTYAPDFTPAPAGTGADGVEGLRPGLEKALEIVRAEMETASSHSGSYQRLGSVGLALRAALDGASGQEGRS